MSTLDLDRAGAEELLAFQANGTLSRDEDAALAQWLSQDNALRDSAAFSAKLRSEMQALPMPQSPGEFGLARLMRAVAAEDAPLQVRSRRGLWTGAIAASAAALVSAFVTAMALRGPAEEPLYVQASGDGDLPVLTVSFRPEARLADVAALLQEHDLIIVDGPGALGLYRLAPPPGSDSLALAETLRAADHLVLSVDDTE
ncbi:hypothetical protein [Gemmobacter serpentinus]|uniref:hypothetical protein n=1 Tax=Gemmobacter serpentinus TaxID=2652247 RepID=UPI0018658259|nr:hypothetical protein [Gemmobacter serpentinus]